MSAQVWREEKLNAEKRHVTEEKEFQKYLYTFLHQNATSTITSTSASTVGNNNNNTDVVEEEEDEEALDRKKQALLDLFF